MILPPFFTEKIIELDTMKKTLAKKAKSRKNDENTFQSILWTINDLETALAESASLIGSLKDILESVNDRGDAIALVTNAMTTVGLPFGNCMRDMKFNVGSNNSS